MRRMPFAPFEANEAWLEISLLAQILLRWASRLCLEGELALAEAKRGGQLLLHVAVAWCYRGGGWCCGCLGPGPGPRR